MYPQLEEPLSYICSVLLGIFWPLLTTKQNITIGMIRTIQGIPSDIRFFHKIYHLLRCKANAIIYGLMDVAYNEMIGLSDAEVWSKEVQIQKEIIPLITSMNKDLFRIAIIGPILVDFTAFFLVPYIIYRVLKWRGFYRRYSLLY